MNRTFLAGAAGALVVIMLSLGITMAQAAEVRTLKANGITVDSITCSGSQLISTQDPASTAATASTVLANPATCAANELLVTAAVADSRKASFDCEGDLVAVKGDFSGAVTGTAQIKTTLNPASTTNTDASLLVNPAACATNELLFGALVNGSTKASVDCEGDVVGVKADFSGVLDVSDGTAADPSIQFTSDNDGSGTGFFRSAANAIGVSTAGTERWTFNASGALNPVADNSYDIGNGTVNPRDISVGRYLVFEGSTQDGNEITMSAADPGADFTITVPAETGTMLTSAGTHTSIVICGDATTVNNNTVYYGPNVTVSATGTNGLTCDTTAAGNVTEATADAPVFGNKAFKVAGMICRSPDANADLDYTLRTAAGATVPSVTCTIADNSTDCVADVQTTTDIAAGATIAVAVHSTADVGTVAFVCTIDIIY